VREAGRFILYIKRKIILKDILKKGFNLNKKLQFKS
jgi:hypothetical protein